MSGTELRPGFEFAEQISSIAKEAGSLLRDYFRQRVKIEYKGDVDLVTVADRASEKLIVERLRALWPDFNIVGEEGTRQESGSEYRWYVDPLDGTTNFAHGYPVFCVSIGLEHRGEIVAGVLYDPTRDELFAAEKGRGSYLNGERIYVSQTTHLAESLLATGFPSHKRHKNPNIFFYHEITLKTHGVRRAGSAALDLASVAAGRLDAFWEFNLNPWDTCAGVLIAEEAGATVTNMSGGPWKLDSRETLATNGIIHGDFVRLMGDIMAGRNLDDLPSPTDYAKSRP